MLAFGTVGFTLLEPTIAGDPFEAFYLTLTTVSTVGYGDIAPTTAESRVIAAMVMVGGIGAALYVFQSAFNLTVRKNILRELGIPERRTKMKDHYIVCGYGNVGKIIRRQLEAKGDRFIIVEKDRQKVEELVNEGVPVIEGDAEEEEVLERANIMAAKGLLTTMPDATNIMVVITAHMMNPRLRIISEVEDNRNVTKLMKAGATELVHCHEMGARVMVTKARNTVIDPVCGGEVDPSKAPFVTEHEGIRYFFCSKQCEEAFRNNPARFVEMQRMVESACSARL